MHGQKSDLRLFCLELMFLFNHLPCHDCKFKGKRIQIFDAVQKLISDIHVKPEPLQSRAQMHGQPVDQLIVVGQIDSCPRSDGI